MNIHTVCGLRYELDFSVWMKSNLTAYSIKKWVSQFGLKEFDLLAQSPNLNLIQQFWELEHLIASQIL